jgi:hypothetical protein
MTDDPLPPGVGMIVMPSPPWKWGLAGQVLFTRVRREAYDGEQPQVGALRVAPPP